VPPWGICRPLGFCLSVLDIKDSFTKKILTYALSFINETPDAAYFADYYNTEDNKTLLFSGARANSILLNCLMELDPSNYLIPKIAKSLVKIRNSSGHWGNTQSNCFSLVALSKYFEKYENITPRYRTQIWQNNTYIGDCQYTNYSTETHQFKIPFTQMQPTDESPALILSKQGEGRMYYRMAITYALTDTNTPPQDKGFKVSRTYSPVDQPDDVKIIDNLIYVVAGKKVKVTLVLETVESRYHVALVDKLPSGFEVINTALKGTEKLPTEATPRRWFYPWYSHQNLRNERVECFAGYISAGKYTYSYYARATSIGRFQTPPVSSEEMYNPEICGRSESSIIVVQ